MTYKYKLDANLKRGLLALYQLGGNASKSELDAFLTRRGSYGYFCRLELWGLAKLNAGKWGITELGRSFIEGKVAVPSYLMVKHKNVLGSDPDLIFIDQIKERSKRKMEYIAEAASQMKNAVTLPLGEMRVA